MINKLDSLPNFVKKVVKDKATEPPFSNPLNELEVPGTYLCRQCGLALFRSSSKFHSGCGWPSFDQELPNAVTRLKDSDGLRTEIVCARCQAHLGHVFQGENFTEKNIRHCVNSVSLDFVGDQTVIDTEEAIFAAGCFWGVEYYFKQLPGVIKVEVGYTGGKIEQPSYKAICKGDTGHFEAIRVIFDVHKLNFETVAKFFFEIHDPTQTNGQGPDLGEQYLSVAFYYNEQQKQILLHLIEQLKNKGYSIATKVLPVSIFWVAEEYHQDYYAKTGKTPYCHRYQKRF